MINEPINLGSFVESSQVDPDTGNTVWVERTQQEPIDPHPEEISIPSIIVEGQTTITDAENSDNIRWFQIQVAGLPEQQQEYLAFMYQEAFKSCHNRQILQGLMGSVDKDVKILQSNENAEILGDGQPWLDKEREKAFEDVIKEMSAVYDRDPSRKEFQTWISQQLNALYGLSGDRVLKAEDMSTVVLRNAYSTSASVFAGRRIERPLLVFIKDSQYRAFIQKLYGNSDKSAACYIPSNPYIDLPKTPGVRARLAKTGLLLASGEHPENLSHETRHSADRMIGERLGFDTILSEIFADYVDILHDPELVKNDIIKREYFDDFTKVDKLLEEATAKYGGKHTVLGEQLRSYEWYQKTVSDVVDRVLELTRREGSIAAQRILAQTRTLREFFNETQKHE